MKANIVDLTYNIDREEFKELIRNTLLIKELIDDGFNITNLGSVLDSTKYGFTASALEEGNVKMIRITDLKNNSINLDTVPFCNCKNYEDYLVKKGDILIGRTGTVGKSFLLDYELDLYSVYASYLIRLRINKDIVLSEYVYLYLNSYYFWNQLHEIKSGGVKMNINANKIKGLQIPICSIEEQRAILDKKNNGASGFEDVLNTVSNIHLLENTISNNENYVKLLKQSILQEAIEGKLTKSWREENKDIEPASVLLERIKAEKEELIKQKKLKKQKELDPILEDDITFEIPNNNNICRLAEVIQINPRNKLDDDIDTSFIPMKLIKDGFVNEHISEKRRWKEIKTGFTHFQEDDVVFAKITPCFQNRKSAVMKKLVNGYGAGTTELIVLRSFKETILPELLLYFVKSKSFIDLGVSTYTGTAGQQRVDREKLLNMPFLLPPLEEQKEIVKKVEELMKLCDELEKQTLEAKENSENLMNAVLGEVFNQKK